MGSFGSLIRQMESSMSRENIHLMEMNKKIVRELEKWEKENDLPFDNIFPEDTLRISIPIENIPRASSILRKIDLAGLRINYEDGTVTDGRRATRLGKYVLGKKSPFTNEEKDWFIHQGDILDSLKKVGDADKYVIVVSRSPIDVVRMSDHAGIDSCHAPGKSYFHCAVEEAKGMGLVAYVVYKKDLAGVDLQAPEIFYDEDRGVQGIEPVCRVRLRKFHNEYKDYDLAVPEMRVYGEEMPGFLSTLDHWALEVQQDVLEGKRPRMKDFIRLGGHYADNIASRLFNNLFGDTMDHGDTKHQGNQDLFEQYDDECQEYSDRYLRDLEFAWASYEVEDIGNDEPYVMYHGGCGSVIPCEMRKELPSWGDRGERAELNKRLRDLCYKLDIWGVEEVEVEPYNYEGKSAVYARVYIDDEERHGHPDNFGDFCRWLSQDVEDRKEDFELGVLSILVEMGYVEASHPVSKALGHGHSEDSWTDVQFKHFNWDQTQENNLHYHSIDVWLEDERGNMHIELGNLPGFDRLSWTHHLPNDKPGFREFRANMLWFLNREADKWIENENRYGNRQKSLFGEPERVEKPFSGQFHLEPRINFSVDPRQMVRMGFEFTLDVADDPGEVEDALAFVKYLDNHFDWFVGKCRELFESLIVPSYPVKKQTGDAISDH